MTAHEMETLLRERFNPEIIQIQDESRRHANHAGAKHTGGGHYRLVLVSNQFDGKTLLERHRLVYEALEPLKAQVHALAMNVMTPQEWKTKNPA